MASTNHNPLPIDEGDLLALVEGVALPAERAAKVREAVKADPRLMELATLMRADRDGLAALGDVAAPADLLDRVEMQLEREALVGLATSEAGAASDSLPISSVIPVRPSIWNARWARPMAAAAALAIMAGGTLMLLNANKRPKLAPPPLPGENLANSDVRPSPVPVKEPGPGPALANNDKPTPDVPTVTPDTTPQPVAVAHDDPAPDTITVERALAAARDGKLVLRITAPNPVLAENRVRSITRISIDELANPAYQQVAGQYREAEQTAWAAAHPKRPSPAPTPGDTPAVAGPNAPIAKNIETPPATTPVYDGPAIVLSDKGFLANIASDAAALEALKRALSGDQPAQWQIVSHPVKLDIATDAESLLWWTAPNATWGPRLRVPVIIQAK